MTAPFPHRYRVDLASETAERGVLAAPSRPEIEGTVDKTPTGLAFTSILVRVSITVGAADVPRATTVLERAKRHCLVANSLRCPVTVEGEVSVG